MTGMKTLTLTLATLTTACLVAISAPAHADHGGDDGGGGSGGGGGDDRVIKTGTCSDGASWKLKVKTDDGGLEVEGEVDSNQSGQQWGWKVKDNGSVAAKGSATTGGRSGSFSVERTIADLAGTDTITFKARRSGGVCTGTIAF
jgi:hypothetical protein